MKQFMYKNAGILLGIFLVFFIASCSSDDNNGNSSGGTSFSMKINGDNWTPTVTTLFTEDEYNSVEGDYYLVYIGGNKLMDMENPDADSSTESIAIYIAISASKFQNPKGMYPILKESDVALNQASAVFMSDASGQQKIYTTTDPGESGMVEITGFEVGEQTIMGEPTGVQGYKKLSGNFQVVVNSIADNTDKITITDGKFNLSSGLGF